MNVSLTPELERLVQRKVASGRYGSASEVVREALRVLEQEDRLRQLRFEKMQGEVAAGLRQLDAGQSSRFDPAQIKGQGRERRAQRAKP